MDIQLAGKGHLLSQSTQSGDTAEASSHKAAFGTSWVAASASYCLSVRLQRPLPGWPANP